MAAETNPSLVLTRNFAPGRAPLALRDYEAAGGYAAARQALTQHSPAELRALVTESGLRGRGGAGFPTGKKWGLLPPLDDVARPRYFVCNFDEMEPGTYKDRVLVERDPHLLLEGLLIAARACECDSGYLFVRGEYHRVHALLRRALDEARQAGYLGADVLGTGWDFDIHLHLSAGRYMCGEETGLLNALEGRRATPRAKPPYPVVVGAWGRPTVINNVETLCCVPAIVRNGAAWFRSLGLAKDAGTKLYAASGRVQRPAVVELPLGTTLRQLLFEHQGGMQPGYTFRAALPGGASTRFLSAEQLDVPLDYDSLKPLGHFLGTGTAVVLDDHTCPVAMVANLLRFFARESCGWCTPCREGLPWLVTLLDDLEQGRGAPGDVELLLEQAERIGPNTFCALALGAVQPLQSGIALFRDEFEEHARRKQCPRRGPRQVTA